jgi:MFS family permease
MQRSPQGDIASPGFSVPNIYVAIVPVFVAVFILIAGNGMITTIVPLRATLEGFSQSQIGIIGSAYFVGMLAGSWSAPAIVRRAGHIRAFAAYAAVAAVATLGLAILVSPSIWPILRGVIGFSFAGLYAIVEGWVSVKAGSSHRGRALALYNVVHFAGSAVGQQVLRLAEPRSFTLFSGAASFLMLSLVPMALTRAEPPPLPPKGRLEIVGLLQATPIAAVGILLVGWANGTFWSLVPAYVERLGMGAGVVASFMTAVIIGSATGPYPLGRLSDLMDRRWVIAGAAGAAALVETALVIVGMPAPIVLYVFGFFLGLTTPVIYPLITAHAVDRMGADKAVTISSTLLFLYCIGGIIGPVFASALMTRLGDTMLFVHNAVVHTVLMVFVIWRIVKRPAAVRIPVPDDLPGKPPSTH